MKALENVKWATRVERVNELQRVGQHRGERADCNRPDRYFRREQPEGKAKSGGNIDSDDCEIPQGRIAEGQAAIVRTFAKTYRAKWVVPVRNRVNCKMACEPCDGRGRRVQRQQAGDRSADDRMRTQDHVFCLLQG